MTGRDKHRLDSTTAAGYRTVTVLARTLADEFHHQEHLDDDEHQVDQRETGQRKVQVDPRCASRPKSR